MRKNKILFNLWIAASVLSFTSCMGVLDKEPLDLMTEENVWNDVKLAQGVVNKCYSSIFYFSKYQSDGKDRGSDCQTDQFWCHWQLGNCADDNVWTTSTDFGWNKFGDVRNANVAIEHLTDEVVRSQIGEDEADNLLGQAYLLKAATYFLQARKFGGWIIVEHSLDSDGQNAAKDEAAAEKLQLPRATMKETYDYAIDLCEKAASLLNEKMISANYLKELPMPYCRKCACMEPSICRSMKALTLNLIWKKRSKLSRIWIIWACIHWFRGRNMERCLKITSMHRLVRR